jgi:hypothetical protein
MSNNLIQSKKKKKKGHAPAHQNKFAFYHNPKSKKTAQIMESKISNVCLKCREKLEWRKKYRKYKPLTQPSICNICHNRNITAAYHTICYSCSRQSEKARSILHANQRGTAATGTEKDLEPNAETSWDQIIPDSAICAICVQEPAMLDHEDEKDLELMQDSLPNKTRALSLRQKKSLLRKQQLQRKSNRTTKTDEKEDTDSKSEDEGHMDNDDNNTDDEDPLSQAVGGLDKLLVGDAYREQLLRKMETH